MHRHSYFLFGVLSTERVSHISFRFIADFLDARATVALRQSMICTKDAVAIRARENEVFSPAE